MNTNQKGFANIVLVVVTVVFTGAVGYFAFVKKSEPITQQPTPTPIKTQTASPTPTLTSQVTNFKTYTSSQYGYQIKYPKDWTLVGEDTILGLRAPGTKPQPGDFVADVYVDFETSTIQNIINETGSQFSDRKVVREDVTIGNNVPAVRLTVSTPSYPHWISHNLLVEVVSGVLQVSDGARNTPEFWSIASTLELIR